MVLLTLTFQNHQEVFIDYVLTRVKDHVLSINKSQVTGGLCYGITFKTVGGAYLFGFLQGTTNVLDSI